MRQRGVSEYSLKCIRWSVYRRIVVWHHTHDTDICSYELLSSLCELQRIRYEHGEISRKFYRAFVTAAFRIRSYVDTGKVDFSIVKDTKYYKPGKEYQELVDSILKASGLTEGSQYKLAIIMRQFFCFFEKRYSSIEQATDRDFLDFIPEAAKKNPNNMTCTMRALRYITQYLNDHQLAEISVDLSIFRPQSPPNRMIAPFTQDDIAAVMDVILKRRNGTRQSFCLHLIPGCAVSISGI